MNLFEEAKHIHRLNERYEDWSDEDIKSIMGTNFVAELQQLDPLVLKKAIDVYRKALTKEHAFHERMSYIYDVSVVTSSGKEETVGDFGILADAIKKADSLNTKAIVNLYIFEDPRGFSEYIKNIYSNKVDNGKKLTESVIFHEVDEDEVEDITDWAILDNDKWFANGDGLILEGNKNYEELIFSKNHEAAIHEALEENEGWDLLVALKKITGLKYVEDEISGYFGGWQKIYYPKDAFTKEDLKWFSDAYFGNYIAYATADENVDPQYVWVFDSDRRRPEEVIAADTGLPVSEVVIKKIKGYKKTPIYED